MPTDPSITRRSLTSQRQGMGCLVLFGLVFAGFGLFFFYISTLRPAYQSFQARSWQTVPCQIISSSVTQSTDSDNSTTYGIQVAYSYMYQDRRYQGDRYDFSRMSDGDRGAKQRIVSALPPGSQQTCWVDPANPSHSVLNREFTPHWFPILLPLVFAAVGILIVYVGFRNRRRTSLTTSGQTSTNALPLGKQSLIPGPDGMVTLKSNMATTAIGLTVFSLFWNGFVWTFLILLWRKHDLSIFPTIFLGVFALIGLLILFLAIRSILQATVPRPIIRIPAEVHIGDKFQLRWEFRRPPSKVQSMQLYLVGKESATYQRGTQSTTDTSIFARLPIIDLMSWAQITTGSAVVQIPADTMHTFMALRNRITWAIELNEVIPNWPDVKCEYALTILPLPVKHD